MQFYDDTVRKVRIHILFFSGDQPAVSKIAGLSGPNGKSPCRECKITGYYSNHYYFPSRINTNATPTGFDVFFEIDDVPVRSTTQIRIQIDEIEGQTGYRKAGLQGDYGIREKSLVCMLPGMHEYTSFPQDIMHTFYNVQRELLRIMFYQQYLTK